MILNSHGFPVYDIYPGEEPRLAYNRVAMTSYFQHRSPEELAMSLGGVFWGKMSGEAVV